jgi:tetratricopeptide (TPR) repeat protein
MSFLLFTFIGYTQDAKDLYIKGVDLFEQKRYQDAIKVFTKAIEKNPKFKEAYFKRGVSYTF